MALSSLLGYKVSFPGSEAYDSSLLSYFSLQESQIRPLCIVSPTTTEDVSKTIGALSSSSVGTEAKDEATCQFAIRSGGHAGFAGAANAAGGVTIDLRGLDSIKVSDDRMVASIGVGAIWKDVYSKLDALNLSVAGGRAGPVGVGGLVTGGGISYFSPRYGWTCDTVLNFEVVLSDGSVVDANMEQNPDLLFALRGGSNNFGVVTRVDLRAFEQGDIWGGSVYYPLSSIDQQLRAFVEFNLADAYDEYASLIMSFGYAHGKGSAIVSSIEYTKAVEEPPVFRPFMEIPYLHSTMRITNMTDISIEQGSFSPNGQRQLSVVTTHASALSILAAVYDKWNASLSTLDEVPGLTWSISLEPLPPAIYAHAPKKSNALGLCQTSGSLVVTLLSASWVREEDDAAIEQAARRLFAAIEDEARRLDLYNPFVYLNYAAPWQYPIASYGDESVKRLKKASKAFDAKRMFQFQVPGGFKLP